MARPAARRSRRKLSARVLAHVPTELRMTPPVPTQAAQLWEMPPAPEAGHLGGEDGEGEAGEAGEAGDEGDEGGEGAEGGEGEEGDGSLEWLPGTCGDGEVRRRGGAAGGEAHAAATKATKATKAKAARAAREAKVTTTKFDVLITSYEVLHPRVSLHIPYTTSRSLHLFTFPYATPATPPHPYTASRPLMPPPMPPPNILSHTPLRWSERSWRT